MALVEGFEVADIVSEMPPSLHRTCSLPRSGRRVQIQGTSIRERFPQNFEPKRFSPPKRQGKVSEEELTALNSIFQPPIF